MTAIDPRARLEELRRQLQIERRPLALTFRDVLRDFASLTGAGNVSLFRLESNAAMLQFSNDETATGRSIPLTRTGGVLETGAQVAEAIRVAMNLPRMTYRGMQVAGTEWILTLDASPDTPDFGALESGTAALEMLIERLVRTEDAPRYDELTGLPDRSMTMRRIAETIAATRRNATNAALLFLDIDGFKLVNDTFGHVRGDGILRSIALELRKALRADEFVGRIGGDEFAVLLPSVSDAEEAAAVAERLCDLVSAYATTLQLEGTLSLSAGIAIYPNHAANEADWLAHADEAMYHAKRARSRFAVYDPDSTEHLIAPARARFSLTPADVEREVFLCFQPIFEASSGKLRRLEAYVRWLHPEAGMLSANEFLGTSRPAANAKLDAWVLRTVSRYAERWVADHGIERVHANLVVPDERHARDLLNAIEDIPASRRAAVSIELNTGVAEVPEQFLQIARAFADLGLQIGLDEFLFGRFSLDLLEQIPAAFIKVSAGALRESPRASKSLLATMALARVFDWDVFATKVEERRERSLLRDYGVRYIQGYALGQPLTIVDTERWLRGEHHLEASLERI